MKLHNSSGWQVVCSLVIEDALAPVFFIWEALSQDGLHTLAMSVSFSCASTPQVCLLHTLVYFCWSACWALATTEKLSSETFPMVVKFLQGLSLQPSRWILKTVIKIIILFQAVICALEACLEMLSQQSCCDIICCQGSVSVALAICIWSPQLMKTRSPSEWLPFYMCSAIKLFRYHLNLWITYIEKCFSEY